MNNPFRPISGASGTLPPHPSGAPQAYMQQSSHNVPPQPEPFKRRPEDPKEDVIFEVEKKRGFFGKLFGGSKSPKTEEKSENPSSGSSGSDKNERFSLPRKSTESEAIEKRHVELIQAVEGIRQSLAEAKAEKAKAGLAAVSPPFPTEHLDALARSQGQVSGVLEKVAGQLDEAGKREGKVVDSLTKLDGSVGDLTRFSEKSVSTMDGMKGLLAKAHGSIDAMQNELKNSAKRYEELCEKIQFAENENRETLAQLQKRTVLVMGFLGLALVVSLIVAISR